MPTPTLKTCNGCGRKCTSSPCQNCRPGPNLTHDDADYRRNRAILLSRATRCELCGHQATTADPLTADHIRPIAAGGTHALTNLRAAHSSCNKSYGATGGSGHPD